MTRKLLVATHNPGKVREYQTLLADLPLEVTYLDAEGITLEVEEIGHTFTENAVLKATAYAATSGLWTWADDSGLEVDALGGAPGVYSSRYAGIGASDADRYRKLLDALTGVSWVRRTARFRCVVALATPTAVPGASAVPGTSEVPVTWSNSVQIADGVCEGIIAFGAVGRNGFGYDPVFYLPDRGLTMAQLPAEDKNQISHRGRAARTAETLLAAMLRG
jgi:XTP/dITP diphosphohydrolase